MEQYSSFQFILLSLKKENKKMLAEMIMNKFCEKEETAFFIKQFVPEKTQQKEKQLDILITSGIKAGTDAFKSDTAIEDFDKAARVTRAFSLVKNSDLPLTQKVP